MTANKNADEYLESLRMVVEPLLESYNYFKFEAPRKEDISEDVQVLYKYLKEDPAIRQHARAEDPPTGHMDVRPDPREAQMRMKFTDPDVHAEKVLFVNEGQSQLILMLVENWVKRKFLDEEPVQDAEECPSEVEPDVFVWYILESHEVDLNWRTDKIVAYFETRFPIFCKRYGRFKEDVRRWVVYKENMELEKNAKRIISDLVA
jgi:hypothetical protein